ncbi:MAG TPA: (S)-ureidoglycine aminohydrolase [Pirellulales bacterium]|jgi:(S)-ureidoglycine aminohydrolase|nr:(S)-ureidoglycine aminohydrolase [Pirellulales bacterium]
MTEPTRNLPYGTTRSRVTRQYALITPDTHVAAPLVGWRNGSAVMHMSPEMGARFAQYTAVLGPGAVSATSGEGIERFVFVLAGAIRLKAEGKLHELAEGQFVFLPAGTLHEISTADSAEPVAARLAVFEKRYQLGPAAAPQLRMGDEKDIAGEVFLGDPALRLQTLLPVEPSFDMAVNLFTYDPGGHLPQVEIHLMEHGLLMLDGTGVYRLADDWFPVQRGDVIWMASYCPQWFVAMGKTPARYLYYKDIHRDSLSR